MAFDSVNRDALWIKLVKYGISCNMINMIKLIYNDVQSCVRVLSPSGIDYSLMFFNVTVGVKQGEPLSPLLFISFINDVCYSLDTDKLTDKDTELLSMFCCFLLITLFCLLLIM